MAVRFYLRNVAAPYTPATLRGAWDASASAVTKLLDSAARLGTWDTATSVAAAETSTDTEFDVLLYRGVTGKLKAGTIGTGTVNVMLPFYESNAAADFSIHLHIYVTQGDSDTPRGTLLTDYRDGAGANELTASNSTAGIDLNAAQSLSSLAVSDNDRIVVEVGYVARNASATSYTGTLYYGQTNRADLAHGGAYNSGNAYIEFSEAFEFMEAGRVSQGPVEALLNDDGGASRVSQGPVEVLMTDDANPARVTQAVGELLYAQTATARVTQIVAEILAPVTVATRVTQIVAELLTPTVIDTRTTQLVAELLDAALGAVRVTQLVVELLGKSSTYCGPPSLSPAPLCGKPDVLAWLEWTVQRRSEGGGGSVPPTVDETVVVIGETDVPNLFEYSYTYTDAQIKALPTTPLQVLPSPGVGNVWQILACCIMVDCGGGDYTNLDDNAQVFLVAGSGTTPYGESERLVNNPTYGWYDVAALMTSLVSTKNIATLTNRWAGEVWADSGSITLAQLQTAALGIRPTTRTSVAGQADVAVGVYLDNQSAGDLTGGSSANVLRTRTVAMRIAL